MTIADSLTYLDTQRAALAANLAAKGVPAENTEPLDVLVPKILEIDPRVKAYLELNGSNGSTTITDRTGKTWTAAGTAQLSTAQSHAGGASLLLDGNSDWIYTADSDDFNLGGNDFTIEMWLRFTTLTNGAPYVIMSQYASGMAYMFWYIHDATPGQRNLYLEHQGTGGNRSVNTSAAFTLATDTWYHFAMSKKGPLLRMFKDGAKIGNDIAYAYTIDDFAANLVVGAGSNGGAYWIPGYIDNFIFTKGGAKYWDNFTPD